MNKIVIESISQKKNSKKFVVKTSEEEYVMTEDTIIKFHIFKDKEFSKMDFKKIIYDIKINESFNKVLNYLNYGPRSEYEIRLYIQKNDKEKTLKVKDYNEIIARLRSLNYVNDELYAKQIVDYYKATKGKNYIKQYLREKRVDNSIIENSILLIEDDEEIEIALKIANKYVQTIRKYPFKKQKEMLMNKLLRSGFSLDSINKIITRVEVVDESDLTLEKDYFKLLKKFENKNMSSFEKKQHILNSLIAKGYDYKKINSILK